MIRYNKETPVLLIAQGRHEIFKLICDELHQHQPQRLYIFYNAPKNEAEKISREQIKSLFTDADWNCSIKSFHNKTPIQHATLMYKALGWFFRHETEGIILDGRSIPEPAFFAFCSCMLEEYRYDERIGHISGYDFRKAERKGKTNDPYYFSKLFHTDRGWASWRRVWQDMDAQLKSFSAFKKSCAIDDIPTHRPFQFPWYFLFHNESVRNTAHEFVNLVNNRMAIVPDYQKLAAKAYELPELKRPSFMINPLSEELDFQELKYQMPAITVNKPDGMTFLRDKLFSFRTEDGQRIKIPRIIHQIYEDPAGPTPTLLRLSETWKENMPDWEYRFWNRPMIHEFLKSTCPDFEVYYHSYPFDVQRWDAIRYLILYHIGGLYVDFDYECFKPLDVLLAGSTCCMGMEPTVNSRVNNKSLIVGNALMAAKPKHPYMAAIIEDMKTNFATNYHHKESIQVMETTGPFMVTRVYEQRKRKRDVALLPADLVAPLTMREVLMLRTGNAHPDVLKKAETAYAVHYFFGSWTEQTL